MFSRRDLLLGGAAVLAGSALPVDRLLAQQTPLSRNLILVLASGGWDVTYALDPKPSLETVDAPAGEVRRFGESPILVDGSRPAVATFFERWGPITAVVNGVQVRSVAHPTCRRRILTGTTATHAPDLGAIAAHALGNDLPVPYLVLGDTAFTGALASSTGRVGTTNQIQALIDPAQDYVTPGDVRFRPDAEDADIIRRYLEARAAREQATRGQRGYNAARIRDFLDSLDRGDALQGYGSAFGPRGLTLGLEQQAQVAVDAVAGGIAHSVLLDTRLPWDTHTNNAAQGLLHELIFQGVSNLLGQLQEKPGKASGHTLLDETVVLVLSEMSRTPRFNLTAGKDHWPFTSALAIGAGIRGGRTFGGTDDLLEGQKVDLATGAISEGGVSLLAENLIAGILPLVGVDPAAHLPGVEPLHALAS